MNDLEIMDRQAKLIEHQRLLFINTVEQFKKDLTYSLGMVDGIKNMCDPESVLQFGLSMLRGHLNDMASMLNEFEYRMKEHE